jgi:hypothetical protein
MFKVKGEYLKSKWYQALVPPGTSNVFSTQDVDTHRRFRRLLSSGISESGLVTHRPVVDGKVRLALQRMEEEMEERGATVSLNTSCIMSRL